MTKVELIIKRTSGAIDTVDVTKNFGSMKQERFNRIKTDTKKGNGSDVLEARWTRTENNLYDLRKKYNDVHNEGGEGYIPESDYFMALPEYWENEIITVFK